MRMHLLILKEERLVTKKKLLRVRSMLPMSSKPTKSFLVKELLSAKNK